MKIDLSYIERSKKTGKFISKSQENTKDRYNKYAKKFFKNLTLPRDLKKPIPDYPYIYKWFRKDTTHLFYVGAGVNDRAWKLSRRNNLTINIIRKIGKKGVVIKLFKMKNWKAALKEEKSLIKKYGRRDNKTGILSNMTDGGEGTTGRIMSEEQKKIVSKTNKNRIYTKEQRENLSKKMRIIKANVSEKTREKLRQKFIGKPRPKWMRAMLMENLNRGRIKSKKFWKSKKGLKRLEKLRELTKIWHASDEGRTWHSIHGKETWINRKSYTKKCVNCKKSYQAYFPSRSKYCSGSCKSLYRYKKN